MINNILVNVLESHWRIFGIFGLRQAQDNAGDKEPPNKQGDHGRTLQLMCYFHSMHVCSINQASQPFLGSCLIAKANEGVHVSDLNFFFFR